ncbi:MAG: hypothetical protein ACREBF_02940 [Candidatus Micrarchaeales archaeon]
MTGKEGALLFKEKQIRILLALSNKEQEWNLTTISRAANATYVHTSKFVTRCEGLGLIHVVKHGKIKALSLTPKGNEIADGIAKIIEKMAVKIEEVPQPPVEKK